MYELNPRIGGGLLGMMAENGNCLDRILFGSIIDDCLQGDVVSEIMRSVVAADH